MARAPEHRGRRSPPSGSPPATDNTAPTPMGTPVFAQPQPTADPSSFVIKHPSDAAAYKTIDQLNSEHKLGPMPFPVPRGGTEPILTLAQVLGDEHGPKAVERIEEDGQLVFHAAGDTGSTRGPHNQSLVADKMTADFDEEAAINVPQFFFHLGDVIYNFGESQYYYDQFYEPYRDYPAPILALAGNHDGMVAPGTSATTLTAFLENFCATTFQVTPEAGGLSRTAQIQPGVFFTFEAPLLRIIALYSNVLEDPGVIASKEIGSSQLEFLEAALKRAKDFPGALILAHHHPIYTVGSKHGWSQDMRAQIDKICTDTGVWPHAVLSAHAHNYQRFTRVHGSMQIPYIIAGNGGHNVSPIKREPKAGGPPKAAASASKTDGTTRYQTPYRAPTTLQTATAKQDLVRLESYDDQDYGYLRVVVTASQLRIEYHPAPDGSASKTPDDIVAVNLSTRTLAVPQV
jgi:hypothetical protein